MADKDSPTRRQPAALDLEEPLRGGHAAASAAFRPKAPLRRFFDLEAQGGVDRVEDYTEDEFIAAQNAALYRSLHNIRSLAACRSPDGMLQQMRDEQLAELRSKFTVMPNNEVDVNTFVDLLSGTLGMGGQVTEEQRAELVEVFQAMDVDGSGMVSWPEFTAFVVNLYTAHQANLFADLVPFTMDKAATRVEATYSESRCSSTIYHFDKWDRFAVVNVSSPKLSTVKIMRPEEGLPVVAVVNPPCRVLVAEHLDAVHRLAMATNEGQLIFYEDARLDLHGRPLQPRKACRVNSVPLCLRWDDTHQRLFWGNRAGEIMGIRYTDDPDLTPDIQYQLTPHKGPVMDILVLDRMRCIVTASLDSTVRLSAMDKPVVLSEFGEQLLPDKRHAMGVTALSYSPDYNVLLSVGQERNPYLWVPIAMRNPFIGKLVEEEGGQNERAPHRHPIIAARCIAGTPRVVSCDRSGLMKVWDLRKMMAVQSFHVLQKFSPDFRCHGFAVRSESCSVVAVGGCPVSDNRMYCYTALPLASREAGSKNPTVTHETEICAAVYNAMSQSFITAAGGTIKTWDAGTGGLLLAFKEVVSAPERITSLVLDDRCRRVLLGTNKGHVYVHSAATMVRIFEYASHKAEVAQLCHCWVNRLFISASWAGKLHVLSDAEPAQSAPLQELDFNHSISAMAYNPYINMLVVGEQSGSVSVLMIQSIGKLVQRMATHTWPPGLKPRLEISPVFCTTRKTKSWANEDEEPPQDEEDDADDGYAPEHEEWYKRSNAATDRYVDRYLNPKLCEIIGVAFAVPYPAYVVSDTAPSLSIWSARPCEKPFQPLAQWKPHSLTPSTSSPTVVALDWFIPHSLLLTADDRGVVCVWACSAVLTHARLPSGVVYPKESGAEDRFVCASHVALPDKDTPIPILQKAFRAADQPLVGLQLVSPMLPHVLVSTRSLVALWSLDGVQVGLFRQGERHIDIAHTFNPARSGYTFQPPPPLFSVEEVLQHREKNKFQRNAEIMAAMRAVRFVNIAMRKGFTSSPTQANLLGGPRLTKAASFRKPLSPAQRAAVGLAKSMSGFFGGPRQSRGRLLWEIHVRGNLERIVALGRPEEHPEPDSADSEDFLEEEAAVIKTTAIEDETMGTPPGTPSRVIAMTPKQVATFAQRSARTETHRG
eukprot:RCo052778